MATKTNIVVHCSGWNLEKVLVEPLGGRKVFIKVSFFESVIKDISSLYTATDLNCLEL